MDQPTPYCLDPQTLGLEGPESEHETPEEVENRKAQLLLRMVRSGEIWFPFHRYLSKDPGVLFSNLQVIESPILEGRYRLRSYYPKFALYMPPVFRGEYVRVSVTEDSYVNADILSDLYIEDIRLQAKRFDTPLSMMEVWVSDEHLLPVLRSALSLELITPGTLRQHLYDKLSETKTFRPTWVKGLLTKIYDSRCLTGLRMLDISSGWGDRLLAAMASGMEYLGYDPNYHLEPGHSAMIRDFGDTTKHRVIYEPFEKAHLPPFEADVVLSSPPFFNIEEYVAGQEGQSIVSYPTFEKWMVHFLFVSLLKAWHALKVGGYLVLSVGDNSKVPICEPMLLFIERYLVGSSWEGVIGIQGVEGYPRPMWVWRKVPVETRTNRGGNGKFRGGRWQGEGKSTQTNTKNKEDIGEAQVLHRWNPRLARSLKSMYPELHAELLRLIATHGSLSNISRSKNTQGKLHDQGSNRSSNSP